MSYFYTLVHSSCFLWITVMVPESKLSLHNSRRYTLQGRTMRDKCTAYTLGCTACTGQRREQLTHCGSDVGVGFSELLPYPLSQSRHSIFSGTVKMLFSTWHHPVSTHTVPGTKKKAQTFSPSRCSTILLALPLNAFTCQIQHISNKPC